MRAVTSQNPMDFWDTFLNIMLYKCIIRQPKSTWLVCWVSQTLSIPDCWCRAQGWPDQRRSEEPVWVSSREPSLARGGIFLTSWVPACPVLDIMAGQFINFYPELKSPRNPSLEAWRIKTRRQGARATCGMETLMALRTKSWDPALITNNPQTQKWPRLREITTCVIIINCSMASSGGGGQLRDINYT